MSPAHVCSIQPRRITADCGLTPSLHSGALTVPDHAGGVRWSVTIAGAAHDACVMCPASATIGG